MISIRSGGHRSHRKAYETELIEDSLGRLCAVNVLDELLARARAVLVDQHIQLLAQLTQGLHSIEARYLLLCCLESLLDAQQLVEYRFLLLCRTR